MLIIFKERPFLQEVWLRLKMILNTLWRQLKNAPDKLLKTKLLKKSRVKMKNFRKNLKGYSKNLVKISIQNNISVFFKHKQKSLSFERLFLFIFLNYYCKLNSPISNKHDPY